MRIAHVITRLILGGAEENTLLCCEDMIRNYGDEVLLITGPALGPEGSLLERARKSGVPVAMIDSLRRNIHPWYDVQAYRAIRKTLGKFQPDVVHTHSAKAGLLGRAAAWRLGVAAIVHTVHGAPFHPYQNPIARVAFCTCERWATARCHHIVSVADAMTDLLVDAAAAPREKFTTIYSGMEVEPFLQSSHLREVVRSRLGYRREHIVIGMVARLFHLKGHEYLIRAAGELLQTNRLIRILLVGDGVLQPQLAKLTEECGLSEHVHFAGLVPPEEIPGMVAAMDIVAHTSLREGLPRAIVQGLLAGKPVVSFDIDGAREVVVDGKTGFLIKPQDVCGLARALGELAEDSELRKRMGEQGRANCADRFDHRRMASDLHSLYELLLGHRKL